MPKKEAPKPAEWIDSIRVPKKLQSAQFEYSLDREALEAFKSIPGAGWVVAKFMDFVLEFGHSDLLGRSVRVTSKQFPRIHTLALKASEVLRMDLPPLFIIEHPMPNAFALGSGEEKAFLVVTRRLVEVMQERELMHVLGHELGHVKCQHVLYHTLAVYLANAGLFAGRTIPLLHLLSIPAQMALNAWARRSEISCDRAGLLSCQDLKSALRACLILACGSRELADQVDMKEYMSQGVDIGKSYGKWNEVFSTHPYMPRRMRSMEYFAQSQLYLHEVLRDAKKPYMSRDELDRTVAKVLSDEKVGRPFKVKPTV